MIETGADMYLDFSGGKGQNLVTNKPNVGDLASKSWKRNFCAFYIVLKHSQWLPIAVYDGSNEMHYELLWSFSFLKIRSFYIAFYIVFDKSLLLFLTTVMKTGIYVVLVSII